WSFATSGVQQMEALQEELRLLKLSTQATTLKELLTECHHSIDSLFKVEVDPIKCTKGTVTTPTGRHCPTYLRLWRDFPELHAASFESALEFFHPPNAEPRRDFSPIVSIADTGSRWSRGPIASEADLRSWHNSRVEEFVSHILSLFKGAGTFSNHAHILGRDSEGRIKGPSNADQLYVVHTGDATDLLAVIEYKAPHKLTIAHLRASIQNTADIDVERIRTDRMESNRNDEDAFFAKAQWLLAATTCQIYDYMINAGCPYGCIVTGEAMLFLHIDHKTPTDLQYFLAEPRLDACNDASQEVLVSKTMIAQLMSFCVMAYPPKQFDQHWIRQAKERAPTWEVDYQDVTYETPKKLRELQAKDEKIDLSYKGYGGPNIGRSPIQTRARAGISSGTCNTKAPKSSGPDEDSEDSDNDEYLPKSPSNPGAAKRYQGQIQGTSKRGLQSEKTKSMGKPQGQRREYCTQGCLFGMVYRLPIDNACPNASSHPQSTQANLHALTRPRLRFLIQQQLTKTMDEGCDDLRLQGSRGRLFRLSLDPYGYTFVGKGTISLYIQDLMREGRIYRRLNKLQGRSIPVYLGNIDLSIPWYGIGMQIVHMLLLSYGGQELPGEPDHEQDLQAQDFERALASVGVRHGDLRFPNMLWNQELQHLMFIDFERSRRVSIVADPAKAAQGPQPG
ncbi:MAG: hypothetical protein Q9224_006111, partial [Gallowayella concinna]